MTYTRLAVTPSDPARREHVSAALFAAGAEGLLEEGAAFVSVFTDAGDAARAEAAARMADSGATVTTTAYDPGDWMDAWRRGVGAHQVGGFIVHPPWHVNARRDTRSIVIEPAMGFGTGEHETTRLSLLLLQDIIRAGDVVADIGSGSGVLAIAAAKCGAARVAAVEIDPLAIGNAEENVAANGVAEVVTVIEGDAMALLPLLAPVRVVVANIIASVLLEMFPVVRAALASDGEVIVGGILVSERDAFVNAIVTTGWSIVREECDGEWWGAHIR